VADIRGAVAPRDPGAAGANEHGIGCGSRGSRVVSFLSQFSFILLYRLAVEVNFLKRSLEKNYMVSADHSCFV
jgi:hypothetical protein